MSKEQLPHPHELLAAGFLFFIVLVLLAFLAGCSTVHQAVSPDVQYFRDFDFEVNGTKGKGVMVAPPAREYRIEGRASDSADLWVFTTCHREIAIEDQGKSFKYIYRPVPGLEDKGSCPARVVALNKKGKHSFGFIEFTSPDAQLQAQVRCNGENNPSISGSSVCQSGTELFQEIVFPVEVIVSPPMGPCNVFPEASRRGSAFKFKMPPGECVFAFMEVAEPHRVHRLNTIGGQQYLLKEF